MISHQPSFQYFWGPAYRLPSHTLKAARQSRYYFAPTVSISFHYTSFLSSPSYIEISFLSAVSVVVAGSTFYRISAFVKLRTVAGSLPPLRRAWRQSPVSARVYAFHFRAIRYMPPARMLADAVELYRAANFFMKQLHFVFSFSSPISAFRHRYHTDFPRRRYAPMI